MRKVYLYTTQADMCISVYVNDAEVSMQLIQLQKANSESSSV